MSPFSVSRGHGRRHFAVLLPSRGWTCSVRVGFLKFKAGIVDEETEPKAELEECVDGIWSKHCTRRCSHFFCSIRYYSHATSFGELRGKGGHYLWNINAGL
ncbi:uncharacterized protein LOC119362257 isoform X2 [Triticum dicoccoides]|uniref:uncharacterized protein LOC119362257 isoform X2 n=1 Tax=Triticum dicoccoides TaxID=85692 RepID=UPI00188FF08E|nr:uncharacterized protein LOC119362257 isoform X2 [Triticum dicoccoides]